MRATTATAATTGATPTEPTARTETSRTPEPPLEHLAALVGADALPDFLEHAQGKGPYRRRLPQGAAEALFDWPRLNHALAQHRLHPPRLRLELSGADASKGVFKERRTRRGRVLQDLDPAAMNEKLRDGATLVLDAANELSPPLQRLCAGLSGELIASCQANLYACWGCSQGFDVHWDDHDLFVVQVQGRKRWAFYGFTREHPSYRDRHAEHRKPEAPIEEIVLEPGDMLYLPRGYWHAAVGTGEPTLHLTIGVTRKTGSDFLHWLADDALSDVLARTDLPLESDDETLGARIRVLLATATGAHAAEDLARRYRRHVAASIPQRPTLSFPFLGAEGEPYASDLRLALADGPAHLRAADRPGAFVLSHRGVEYTLAADLRRPVGMIVGGPVAFAEFETAAGPDASAFVREMLARGVFVLAPERTA